MTSEPRTIKRREFLKLSGAALAIAAAGDWGRASARTSLRTPVARPDLCIPGWQGTLLIDGESTANWSVEHDAGSQGSLAQVPGLQGLAVQLAWDMGSGNWVQGKYTFPVPQDLSQADIFGVSLEGGGAAEQANTVALMFADVNDVFYGYDLPGRYRGINQIDRWLNNLSLPKKLLRHFFSFGDETEIDWTRIDRFFFVVKRICTLRPEKGEETCFGGGTGQLTVDHVQVDTAADWPRQTQFEVARADPQHAAQALSYILGQQDPATGLFVSWAEEALENPPAKAWLYDQALVLIAVTREGKWANETPLNPTAQAADALVDFITGRQQTDGHWARAWNPATGEELVDDGWVGDQAWWVLALAFYAQKSGRATAADSAQLGAGWLAAQIDATGKVVGSTEGNVDVWWAMIATDRMADAEKIKHYLLDEDTVWDAELQYWWRGFNDPEKAMDTATWLSAFVRHPLVNQPERGKAALSFVRRTLVTDSEDGSLCGLDGMGPVSIWNEGMAQYVAAGGAGAQAFLEVLLAQQNPDGSMPSSTANWASDAYGWLTTWRGLAPTAWLVFAITGAPFPMHHVYLPFVST